jgi:hypothetical protein
MRDGRSNRRNRFFLPHNGSTRRHIRVPALLYDDKFWLNVFFAAEWALRLAMIVIVPFRRSPDAAKGWLLLIFFEPVAGLILYLLIGRPTLPAWRLVRHADFEALAAHLRPPGEGLEYFSPELSPELQHAGRLAENLGDFPILAAIRRKFSPTTRHGRPSGRRHRSRARSRSPAVLHHRRRRYRRVCSPRWSARDEALRRVLADSLGSRRNSSACCRAC